MTDVMNKVRQELDRLSQSVTSTTWGATNLERILWIIMTAKPAMVYIQNVPPGIRFGLYTTSSREQADVLSLDDEAAGEALAQGPSDGKRVLIRNSNDHRSLEVDEFLTLIERYRMSNVDVQDPTIPNDTKRESFQEMSPADVIHKLREVLRGSKTVGFGTNQIPP